MIAIAGLQRTGTNFLAEVIARHLGVALPRPPFWKHLMPQERGANGRTVLDVMAADPAMRVVVVVKHPVMWLDSVMTRTRADLFTARPEELSGSGDELVAQLGRLYGRYYAAWMAQGDHAWLVRYEDVLAGDHASLLAALGPFAPAQVPAEPYRTPMVSHSNLFTPAERDRYLRQETTLPEATLAIFRAALGTGLDALYPAAPVAPPAEDPAHAALLGIRAALAARDAEVAAAEGEAWIAAALAAHGDDPAVLFLAARFRRLQRKPRLAQELLRRTLALLDARPADHAAGWSLRASVLAAMNAPAEERVALEHVIALSPRDIGARLRLGQVLAGLGEGEAALAQVERARALGAPAARCDAVAALAAAAGA